MEPDLNKMADFFVAFVSHYLERRKLELAEKGDLPLAKKDAMYKGKTLSEEIKLAEKRLAVLKLAS